ncbi:hypothetical protein U9M48_023983 [Paspalum notatum var. saurae]|uniref:Uncharacterized protein n=1 Tax=Paspalum notatum var. saurae TaxID=547442 RepID=A0AAQ3WWJ0_PASNO
MPKSKPFALHDSPRIHSAIVNHVFTSISTGILERSTATLVVPSVIGVVVIRLVFQNLRASSAGHPETLP